MPYKIDELPGTGPTPIGSLSFGGPVRVAYGVTCLAAGHCSLWANLRIVVGNVVIPPLFVGRFRSWRTFRRHTRLSQACGPFNQLKQTCRPAMGPCGATRCSMLGQWTNAMVRRLWQHSKRISAWENISITLLLCNKTVNAACIIKRLLIQE